MNKCCKCNSESERPFSVLYEEWNPESDLWHPSHIADCKCEHLQINQPERSKREDAIIEEMMQHYVFFKKLASSSFRMAMRCSELDA